MTVRIYGCQRARRLLNTVYTHVLIKPLSGDWNVRQFELLAAKQAKRTNVLRLFSGTSYGRVSVSLSVFVTGRSSIETG